VLEGLAEEWHAFRDDSPGERFENHRQRMSQRGKAVRIGALGLGGVLFPAGIAMLFLPGPGILFAVFGLALFAGQSGFLAERLDRAEPPIRRRARAVKRKWEALPRPAKAAFITLAVGLAAVALVLGWRWLRG
jgi:hypothetical protein